MNEVIVKCCIRRLHNKIGLRNTKLFLPSSSSWFLILLTTLSDIWTTLCVFSTVYALVGPDAAEPMIYSTKTKPRRARIEIKVTVKLNVNRGEPGKFKISTPTFIIVFGGRTIKIIKKSSLTRISREFTGCVWCSSEVYISCEKALKLLQPTKIPFSRKCISHIQIVSLMLPVFTVNLFSSIKVSRMDNKQTGFIQLQLIISSVSLI